VRVNETDLAAETLRLGDEEYDEAARVFMAVGEPALVVRPRDADEVAAAIALAVRDDLAVSVRSGGHSPRGHSTNVGGMVIDVRRIDAIEVLDAQRRIVRVGGGATLDQVAVALDRRGWGLTSGDTKSVGVGGLTLGGGMGWMVRRYGLAIDQLVAARVVTADGRVLTASAEEHPDLFWALRGGGGNFGVVVDFDFVVQETTTVHYGAISYRVDDPADLLTRWRDAMRAAPDELSSTLALPPQLPGVPPSALVLVCYSHEPGAPMTEADAALEPLLELGTVIEANITERRFADVLEEPFRPPGFRAASRDTLVSTLDDDVIAAVVAAHQGPAPTAFAVRSLGGAFARVPADATAFAHRDAEVMIVCAVLVPEDAPDEELDAALGPWQAVAARGTGTYIGFQGSATAEDVAAAYPPATYARLAEVKRDYDPDNVFALNHNVVPAV